MRASQTIHLLIYHYLFLYHMLRTFNVCTYSYVFDKQQGRPVLFAFGHGCYLLPIIYYSFIIVNDIQLGKVLCNGFPDLLSCKVHTHELVRVAF